MPRNFWLIYARVRSSSTKYLTKGSYFLTNIIINVYFTFHNYCSQIAVRCTNSNLQTKHYWGWKLSEAMPSINLLRLARFSDCYEGKQHGGLLVEAYVGELWVLFKGKSQPATRKVMVVSLLQIFANQPKPNIGHEYLSLSEYTVLECRLQFIFKKKTCLQRFCR